ncbi:hypothetical protein [Dinoroseobacter sp. S375]|uniref:hypothetical protein n=1 Tax=Dinoroseobacter sp. S375 TaxID=3415136 RepID=UPI003C7D222C
MRRQPQYVPGGAPIGLVADLDRPAATAVCYLRLWRDGPEARARLWNALASGLGLEDGRRVMSTFEDLVNLCARHGRRPLACHGVNCRCLGADEACFAQFITTATEGDREDAMLIAILLVRPDVAPLIAALAADFGHALKRMHLCETPVAPRRPAVSPTLH